MGKYAEIILAASKNKRISLRAISRALGKNNCYMQQFCQRGVPETLPIEIALQIEEMLGLPELTLCSPEAAGIITKARQRCAQGTVPEKKVPCAEDIIEEREKTHGPPDETFGMAAALVSALTFNRDWTKPFEPHEIAITNILYKVARIMQGSYHPDHWDDIGGYALLGKKFHEKSDEG